ncbi:MAG TPA: CARDB domain-containing protein [Gammaproteobacteria bacterium]|nr:CARDB domain-containing protein [Gammaproteobacteria bacterium]
MDMRRSVRAIKGVVLLAGLGLSIQAIAADYSATLSATPRSYSGKCPAKITFTGAITAKRTGRVQYKFLRSDGANAPVHTIEFTKPGTRRVSTTWTLGGASLPSYSGWQSIQILYPQQAQSNKAHFKVKCAQATRPSGGLPDLRVRLAAPASARAGTDIGRQVKLEAYNTGRAAALGTDRARSNGYMIDLVLSRDRNMPSGWASYSANFHEDVLLRGGRVSNTKTLNPGQHEVYRVGAGIPADTPAGAYYLCAKVDSGNKIRESNERNNVACRPIRIQGGGASSGQTGAKKPDLGMYGYLRIGKQKRLVQWNQTITLTPADAHLISGGKPAFDLYYAYREYNGVAASGPFKNKIFFNGKLVSQQTNLSAAAGAIRQIHTQAYLGPQPGQLQIKIDADNEVAESREDNNFHFYVNVRFSGF